MNFKYYINFTLLFISNLLTLLDYNNYHRIYLELQSNLIIKLLV